MAKPGNRLLALMFLVLVSLPAGVNLLGIDGADAEVENRELAAFPRLRAGSSIRAFPVGLADWFDDHFGFRARLIQWYGETRLFLLHVSPSPGVALGKDGWLFYVDDSSLEDYAHVQPLAAFGVRNWRAAVLRARDWMHARRGAYVFTIAPDKHVIYQEEFPAGIRRAPNESRMDQVLATLSDSGVSVDVRRALFDAKAHERIYQRTDTHWNDLGAFAAYQQIIERLRAQNPLVPPAWQRADFEEVKQTVPAMDLAGMIGLKRVLLEEDLELLPKRPRLARVVAPLGALPTAEEGRLVTEIPGSSLPRAVIFRDSFGSKLVPFLSEHFSRAVYLWQNDFIPDTVEAEHADVVIEEIVGRHLYSFVPSPELVPAN
jgi:alginate O-acetyltransferase complex protein AlgJ